MARKSLLSFGIGFLVLGIITAGGFNIPRAAAAQDVVKIGLSAPLTGDWAEYGNDFKRSVSMVIDRANRMGGVRGKHIELVISDSRGDPKESVLIAEKFVADPQVIAEIGDFTSTCCLAAQPIYDRAGMVQLSPTSSHPKFAPGSALRAAVSR